MVRLPVPLTWPAALEFEPEIFTTPVTLAVPPLTWKPLVPRLRAVAKVAPAVDEVIILRPSATEEALKSGASIEEAAQLAAEGTSPGYDFHADVDYRRHLARVLAKRALEGKTG